MLTNPALTDAALVQRIRAGDSACYAELVRRYERSVQAAAWAIVHDVHLAQDIAQESFLKAYRALPALENPDLFAPWLLAITRRTAVTACRSKTVPVQAGDAPEIAAAEPEILEAAALLAAVAHLPPHEQRVILLRYIDEQPIADIAAALGLAPNTVTKQLTRALRRLRSILKEPP